MANPRASIFDTSEDEIDISTFAPKTEASVGGPPPDAVRAVAEAANFRRREVPVGEGAQAPKRQPRRYRTGRNAQFNIKATQAAIDSFIAITDAQGWVLGETLEHAVSALQERLAKTSKTKNS